MAYPNPFAALPKIRNFLNLTDNRFLIEGEWQPVKSVAYLVVVLATVEVVFLILGWFLFRKTHAQMMFDMFVASFWIDLAFVIIGGGFFLIIHYIYGK